MKLYSVRILFFTISIVVASCSNDDNLPQPKQIETGLSSRPSPNPTKQGLRLKKVTQTTYYGLTDVDSYVENYIYQGTRLASTHFQSASETRDAIYHYDGLKITAIDYISNGVIDQSTLIHYNGDTIDYVLGGENFNERTDYTYVGGHVATRNSYSINGSNTYLFETRNYSYTNGNVTGLYINSYSSFPNSTFLYTYEDKNNPLRGMNIYLQQLIEYEGFNGLSVNNPITFTVNYADGSNPQESYYIMTYNSKNYPVHIQRFSVHNYIESDTLVEYYQ